MNCRHSRERHASGRVGVSPAVSRILRDASNVAFTLPRIQTSVCAAQDARPTQSTRLLLAAFLFLLPLALVAGDDAHTTRRQVVNLATVMRLAGAENLDIRLANERVAEARALHEAARMQIFP